VLLAAWVERLSLEYQSACAHGHILSICTSTRRGRLYVCSLDLSCTPFRNSYGFFGWLRVCLGPRDPRSPGTGAACGCADCGPGGAPGTVGPAAWGWGRGRGACEGGAPPYTWLLSKRALTPPPPPPTPQFVTSLISAVSNGSKHSVAQLALVFSPGASSALWASARSQKVCRVGWNDVRRHADVCTTGYEQCTGSGKPLRTV